MKRTLLYMLVVFLVTLAIFWLTFGIAMIVAHPGQFQHWLAIHTGSRNESDVYYGFFSGFGSDFGEATIVAAIVTSALTIYHHHNCMTQGCWRLGRQVYRKSDGAPTPYLACHKCHPAHEGVKRSVPLATIHAAHHEAKPEEQHP